MKVLGWIFIILAILNLATGLVGIANGYEAAGRRLGGAITIGTLGIYLVHRAKQKEEEKQEHEDWSNT